MRITVTLEPGVDRLLREKTRSSGVSLDQAIEDEELIGMRLFVDGRPHASRKA